VKSLRSLTNHPYFKVEKSYGPEISKQNGSIAALYVAIDEIFYKISICPKGQKDGFPI